MNREWDRLLRDYVNKDYNTLLAMAKDSLGRLVPFFRSIDESAGAAYILHFMTTALAVDSRLTDLEYRYFCALLDINDPYEVVSRYVLGYNTPEAIAMADSVFDRIPNYQVKVDLLNLFLCTIAVDEDISREELSMLNTLLE